MYKVIYSINDEISYGTVYASNEKEAINGQKEINSKRSRLKGQKIEYLKVVEII